MKVCIISPSFPEMKCGVGDYTWRLIQHLQGANREIFLLTSDNDKIREHIRQGNLGNVKIFPIVKRWGYLSMRKLLNKISEIDPDVVHIQYQWWAYRFSMIAFLPLLLKLKRKRFLVVTTLHDLTAPYFFPKAVILRRVSLKALVSYSDKIIVIDRVDEGRLKQKVPSAKSKIYYIPIGANVLPSHFLSCKDSNEEIRICNYGYLFPYKGVETLLESMVLLKTKSYKIKLVIIGGCSIDGLTSTYPDFIKKRIKDMGLDSIVDVWGFCEPQKVSSMLANSDICVLPFNDGIQEKRGTFITAMAHRLPIVTTRARITPDNLIDGHNVIFVPALDPVKLAWAISALIENPQLRFKLGQNSYKLYKQNYTWEAIARETQKLYS
jgi:glycosyltransferase involved in cell wall biosynthesis